MKFYSGFCLSNDEVLFTDYLKVSDYNIAGFSYGAIKAFNEAMTSQSRVDTLQLFSPAFFQDKTDKYKRMQNMYFVKDEEAYKENFFKACFLPAEIDKRIELQNGSAQELEELLSFVWKPNELKALQDKGVKIEVYLGADDKIINSQNAKEFFLPYAETYMINKAGHTLQIL